MEEQGQGQGLQGQGAMAQVHGLSELAVQLESYTCTIPEAVIAHYLASAGLQPQDPRIVKLVGIAAQKFLADIANDALQHCKTRATGSGAATSASATLGKAKQPKDKKYTMTMEDLIPALQDYGISARKPNYFV